MVSGGGANAHATAQQYAADYASTNYEDVVSDPDVQAIVIATRHDLHARAVIASLRAGKHVFCEKPLALNMAELDEIAASYGDMSISQPMLMVGFNRRFSPAAQRVKEITATRQNPMMVLYRVNAGYIGSDNWVQGPEGGGRIIGEACHMLDLFRYWTGAPVRSVNVEAVGPLTEHVQRSDNVSVTTTYDDGSVCTLIYTALGASQLGKEYIEVYADGKAMVIDDFKTLHTYGLKRGDWNGLMPDKGHKQALEAFGLALKSGGPGPIAMLELMETSRLVITVNEMLGSL